MAIKGLYFTNDIGKRQSCTQHTFLDGFRQKALIEDDFRVLHEIPLVDVYITFPLPKEIREKLLSSFPKPKTPSTPVGAPS